MATTQNTFTGDGSTTNYSFTFEYIKEADVKATLDGTATTAFTLANATTLSFTTAPANGVAIRIYRDTDIDSLKATFFPGSAIKAEDLNDNFTQNNFAVQEADFNVDTANATADTAKTNSETAIATANTADTNASAAVATANTADTNASAAVTTANTASTNASNAVTTANAASTTANSADANATLALNNSRESDGQGGFISAITKANTAITTANTAATDATSAVNTANAATTTANTAATDAASAVTTANSAATDAASAISTANTASTNATNAVTTANSAASDATSAVATANTASTNASSAVTTANTADTNATAALNNSRESDGQGGYTSAISKANTAITTANAASNAVSNAVLFDLIANVSSIPGSPSNNDYIEIGDSTGIESFTPLSGLPSGFVGASGLTVRLRYDSSATSWVFMNYFANDSETRYVAIGNPNPVYYANQAAFPSATTYHGGIAHSHADGAMYYAHGGNWIKMASDSDVATNTSSIATNTTNIGTNTTDIATNTADIATNTTNIGTKMPLAGGTFTGNVEVGTGIDLNTNGSAQFADEIKVEGSNTPSGRSSRISKYGSLLIGSTSDSIGSARGAVDAGNGNAYFLGTLGVGTASPGSYDSSANNLVVGSASGDEGITIAAGTSSSSAINFADSTSGSAAYTGRILYQHSADALTLHTNGGIERMRVDSSGRLLLGTTTEGNPSADEFTIQGPDDTGITLRSATNGYGNIFFSDGTSGVDEYVGYVQYGHADNSLGFGTAAVQRMIIDSSGNVVVSGNPDNGSAAGCRFASVGAIAAARTSGSSSTFSSYTVGNSTPTISLYANGQGNFSGTVTAPTFSGSAVAGNMIATQAEAEAGTNNDQIMTPLRVAQAIAAQGGSVINSIQRGTGYWIGTSNTNSVSITSVTMNKSMLNNLTSYGDALDYMYLASSTSIGLRKVQYYPNYSWEVIEFT